MNKLLLSATAALALAGCTEAQEVAKLANQDGQLSGLASPEADPAITPMISPVGSLPETEETEPAAMGVVTEIREQLSSTINIKLLNQCLAGKQSAAENETVFAHQWLLEGVSYEVAMAMNMNTPDSFIEVKALAGQEFSYYDFRGGAAHADEDFAVEPLQTDFQEDYPLPVVEAIKKECPDV